MSTVEYKYLYRDRSRHGQDRVYVRVGGRKIRVRAAEGSPEFSEQYHAAIAALTKKGSAPSKEGTLRWLVELYLESVKVKSFELTTQEEKRSVLRSCCEEAHPNGRSFGDCPLSSFTKKMVVELMDRRALEHPSAANKRVIHLSAMFSWAKGRDIVSVNPADGVEQIKYEKGGYHTWTEDEIRQFARHHKLGSRPYLAMALMLFSGARRSDAYLLGRQHLKGSVLEFRPTKTRKKKGGGVVTFDAPAQLLQVINATPTAGDMTFIVKENGMPYASAKSFGNEFGKWCEQAGLPHCSCHGLRKALAVILAEEGVSERGLMAVGGWESSAVVGEYVAKASRKKMASQALAKLKPNLLGEDDEG